MPAMVNIRFRIPGLFLNYSVHCYLSMFATAYIKRYAIIQLKLC